MFKKGKGMKKLITEVENKGLMALLGKRVMIFGMNYIYAGTLTGFNETCVLLEDGGIVYNTGAFDNTKFEDFQKLPYSFYIMLNSIESFSETNKK